MTIPTVLPTRPEFRSQTRLSNSLDLRQRKSVSIKFKSNPKTLYEPYPVPAVPVPCVLNTKSKEQNMKNIVALAVVAAGLALTGCHTVNGVGKDVKSAGTAVSDASGESGKKK